MVDYRPEQVADYLYPIELAAVQYAAKGNGETNNKFIGGSVPSRFFRKLI